jgi:DNA-binding MarR family transcriptional regulator
MRGLSNTFTRSKMVKPILDAIPDDTHYAGRDSDRKATMRNETDKEATSALLAALEPFRAANPTMTLQQLISFLLVAKEEGLTVSEYARRAGLAQGVMTRNLFDLGEYNRRKDPGLGLVEQRPDLQDRRAHLTYLTHKGRGAVGAYRRALDGFCEKR